MISEYVKLFRISQWIKNLFVFVPLLFSQNLLNTNYFLVTLSAFVLFCLASSLVYIINDLVDIKADQAHPKKKFRPLPSGKISIQSARVTAGFLAVIIFISLFFFKLHFAAAVAAYFLLNVFYSFVLKHMVLLDIFSIAAGFMLRVLAGAFVINVSISSWLILTTMFISLFLGVMKRRTELVLSEHEDVAITRKVLVHYSKEFTDQMATVAAAAVIICYALYTVSARTINVFETEDLIYTTPFVVFGIFRYMFLVYLNKQGENTADVIIKDLPMIINIFLYVAVTILIIYV